MGQKIRLHLTDKTACPTCGARGGKPCIEPTIKRRRDQATGQPAKREVRWLHHARKAA